MKVLEFKREGFRETATALRKIADMVETGELPNLEVCVVVIKSEKADLQVFAVGPKADDLQVLGTLELGKSFIVDNITLSGIEE